MGLIGIDLGEKRIGVAIVDAPGGRALPHTTIPRRETVAEDIVALRPIADRVAAEALVVGLLGERATA